MVIEGTSSESIGDDIAPTAKCIKDTKKRNLVTRTGPQKLICCVCHLHHKQAMNAPAIVGRQVLKKVLQKVHGLKVDVIVGDANSAAYRCFLRRQESQDLYNISVAVMSRKMQREVNTGRPFEKRLHIEYTTNNHTFQLGLS